MYNMLILEHSYWLRFWSDQSECFKMSMALFNAENIFKGSGRWNCSQNDVMFNLRTQR